MDFIDAVQQRIPDYARDLRLDPDAMLARSGQPAEQAIGCALAAAAIMGMTNPWCT